MPDERASVVGPWRRRRLSRVVLDEGGDEAGREEQFHLVEPAGMGRGEGQVGTGVLGPTAVDQPGCVDR